MDRKLFGFLSSWQFTLLAMTAMIVPGAVYATVTFSPVAIVDPVTGARAQVDAGRRLTTYDNVAAFANYPGNFVRLAGGCDHNGGTLHYSPPSNKALIIKAVDFSFSGGSSTAGNYLILIHSTAVNSTYYVAGLESMSAADSRTAELGNGFFIRNGETISLGCTNSGSYNASIIGYLVPSNIIPPG